MKFRDLSRQYQRLKPEIDSQITQVISDTGFILGEKVRTLESSLADYVGRKYCIGTGTGTDALVLALMAMGIHEGDAVFVPDFTYIASASAIVRVNAHPVFVDIEQKTFNISCSDLQMKIERVLSEGTYRPRAIISVDMFGLCANYDALEKLAEKYQLTLIEDAAQGLGSSLNGRMAGCFGDIACTSFFPSKPLGCYGDGGAVFTDDEAVKNRVQSLRTNGRSLQDKYDNVEIGLNSRLDTLQAGVLLAKLGPFQQYELSAVNAAAARYSGLLADIIETPTVPKGYFSNRAQYTVLLKDAKERSRIISGLKEKGIPTVIYYPRGLHEQKCFSYLNPPKDDCPVTDFVKERCLSLPLHPYITAEEQDLVCSTVRDVLTKN